MNRSSQAATRTLAVVVTLTAMGCGQEPAAEPVPPPAPSRRTVITTPRPEVVTKPPTAHTRSAAPGGAVREGQDFVNSLGMKMVWIPPGSFRMGDGTNHEAERPVHRVTVKHGFWMAAHEMTQARYRELTGENPSKVKGDDLPVTRVNWASAFNLCSSLTNHEIRAGALPMRYVYLLPSEAQWEYAARAGTTGATYDEDVDAIAWHLGNSDGGPHPVGQKRPNAWGLFDMLGNVAEWCQDGLHRSYQGAPSDETPWVKGMVKGERISRGGSFDDHAHFSSAYMRRMFGHVKHATVDRGLRFVVMKRGQRR